MKRINKLYLEEKAHSLSKLQITETTINEFKLGGCAEKEAVNKAVITSGVLEDVRLLVIV